MEELRQKVINGERKLRMTEVESFTDTLGQIGRLAAHLKSKCAACFSLLIRSGIRIYFSELPDVTRPPEASHECGNGESGERREVSNCLYRSLDYWYGVLVVGS